MQIMKRTLRAATALLLAVVLVAGVVVLPGTTLKAEAASNLTSIGLAEHGLMAYRDGWKYAYATHGNKNEDGVRTTDCSGLVYAYLCWDEKTKTVKPNYSYPRTVSQLINNSSVSGSIDTIPRTHGLLVTVADGSHVGIYVGNEMVTDNSSWKVNMRYQSVWKNRWAKWHKLDCITYPTTGWYLFDGDYYYYENGQYVVNTTRTFDGVTYTFGASGASDKQPDKAVNEGYGSSAANTNAKVTAGVRLRKGPGTNYDTITVLPEGTRVNVINTKTSGWYAVNTVSGQTGFVSSQYVKITGTVKETDVKIPEPDTDSSSSSATGETGKVTTAVHLRSGKSTDSESLGVIAAGTSVTVTDKSNSSWYKVSVNGKTGYIFSEYIQLGKASSNSSSSGSGSKEKLSAVTTAGVYLRSGKGTNYSSVALLAEGTKVTVTDRSNSSWYAVTVDGKSGFVSSQYLEITGQSSSSSGASGSTTASAMTTAGVHLRSGRGSEYDSIALVNAYTPVTVTDTSDSKWYGVTVDGKSGYIASQYIKLGDTAAAPAETKITTAYLNLRESASTDSAVLIVIPEGAEVTIVEKTSDRWYKVSYNNKTGYVSTEYLK